MSGPIVERIAGLQFLSAFDEFLHEGVKCGFMNQDALHRDATLAGVSKTGNGASLRGEVEVGVVMDDGSCVPA